MLCVTGIRTSIVEALCTLVRKEKMIRPDVDLKSFAPQRARQFVSECDRFVFAQGVLHPKPISRQTSSEISDSLAINLVSVVQLCESVLSSNDRARICVIGSESGIKGSYDTTYALGKAALHRYVETKRLRTSQQQLVCVAPSIIWDSGMTQARGDLAELEDRKAELPKQRYLSSMEVARLVHFLLYVDGGYITNTVIQIDGGKRA